jgi:hypothetical protein
LTVLRQGLSRGVGGAKTTRARTDLADYLAPLDRYHIALKCGPATRVVSGAPGRAGALRPSAIHAEYPQYGGPRSGEAAIAARGLSVSCGVLDHEEITVASPIRLTEFRLLINSRDDLALVG